MNPRLKGGGLQLGASRCNRLHDWYSPRDILGGVSISVVAIAALLTDKAGLTLAVLFRTVSAHMARLRRVARVNQMQWHASKSSLIGEERTELTKRPGTMAITLRLL